MDSPSFTYNMRYQILYPTGTWSCSASVLRTLSYSAYDDDLGRGPHKPDRLTSHIARTATGPCRFHALGLPAPCSSVFHRDLIGFCLDLVISFCLLCIGTYGQAEESIFQKKKRRLGSIIGKRTLDVDLGSEAMMYHLQFHRASRDPGTMKTLASPPHNWYHAALTGIWGQLG